MTERLHAEVARSVRAVRDAAPLVHGISGTATQGLVADGLLAAGARPLLTSTRDEAPTLVAGADALLVNLGSLSTDAREAIEPTVEAAVRHGIPWVLDPAAVGAAPVRTPLARALLTRSPAAVRGNASEVLTLHGGSAGGRGPDSTASPASADRAARAVGKEHGCVVAVSGAADLVTDGDRVVRIANGNPLLARISGTGCLLGALTAAHLATAAEAGVTALGAVVAATAQLTCASERTRAAGPGSFGVELLDALDALSGEDVAGMAELRWE